MGASLRKAHRLIPVAVISLATALATAVVPASPASAAITPAAGVQIKIANTGKCLNVTNNSTANDAAIIQYTCGDSYVNDKFRVRALGSGNYQIIANSSGKCLNVYKAAVVNDTPVHQYTCSDTAQNNLWKFVPVVGKPTFRIVSLQSGKCLNISKGLADNNQPVIIYTCTTVTTPTNDQFYFPPAASAVPTPLTSSLRTPVVAVQGGRDSQVGPLVYAYSDNNGLMWRGFQTDPDVFSNLEWTPAPGLEVFAGHPQINAQADGKVQIAARNTADGDLWLYNQTTKGQAPFGAAQDVGGAASSQPAMGKLPDGKLVTFALVNGGLWHLPQDGTNVPYAAWRFIGGANLTGEVAVVTIRDGLRLFALNTSGVVQTATYRNGLLSDWAALGTEQFTGTVSATVLPGYRTRVVARNADGLVFTKAEKVDGTFDAEWTPVAGFAVAGSAAVTFDQRKGVSAIVARGADGIVSYSFETAQASGVFGEWIQSVPRVIETDPTIVPFTGAGGLSWGYVVRDADFQVWLYTVSAPAAAARGARTGTPKVFTEHALPRPPK